MNVAIEAYEFAAVSTNSEILQALIEADKQIAYDEGKRVAFAVMAAELSGRLGSELQEPWAYERAEHGLHWWVVLERDSHNEAWVGPFLHRRDAEIEEGLGDTTASLVYEDCHDITVVPHIAAPPQEADVFIPAECEGLYARLS